MSTPYDSLVAFYSARFAIKPGLAQAQMLTESSGNPNAISPKGARGLFQIEPETAVGLLFEPEVSVMMGTFYLRLLYWRTLPVPTSSAVSVPDRWLFALAAYNAGPERVADARARAEAAGRSPNSFADCSPFLPDETRNYVSRIEAERINA